MSTYRIVPSSLAINEWTTVIGTPITAVAGLSGGGTNLIKTPLSAGNYHLRALFNGACFYLNGSGTPTSFASLPAGFTPTSATARVIASKNGDNSAITYLQYDVFTEGTADDVNFAYPSTIPSALLLYLRGVGVRGAGSIGSSLLVEDGNAGTPALMIDGNYTIVSSTWYYNPTTDHFEYVLSTDPVPSAPWDVASPRPGDPVPVITSVKRYSVYTDGVGSVLVAPAMGCAGTLLFIAGSGFGDGAQVTIGGVLADNIIVEDETLILCEAPTHADGTVDVVVYNADGQTVTAANAFTYTTPWWVQTTTYIVDGIETGSYSLYVQQCEAPADDVWTLTTAPSFDNKGWYVSPSGYTGDVAALQAADHPAPPRMWADISAWATSDTGMLGGAPAACCVHNNRLIYPATGYTVGTNYPPIRVFDGLFDHELCRLGPTTSDTVPKAVLAMLAANGTIYFTAFESGTSSADWRGRVFHLDLASVVITPLGAQFAAGEMPYALAWHAGRLWCGTNNGIGTAGKVYSFRPGVDTAWTADYTLSTSSVGGCTSLCSYNGKLYVGTDNASGSRGKVLVRDTAGAYTTSDTGTGGTAHINNGYLAMCVFGGNLYASYWNNDATAVSLIRKYDGSSWSTVYTGVSGTLRPFICLVEDNGVLFAIGGGMSLTGIVLTSSNGTAWTDRTANLPESTRTLEPMVGTLVI